MSQRGGLEYTRARAWRAGRGEGVANGLQAVQAAEFPVKPSWSITTASRSFAAGSNATVENIELRCRAHNAYEAQLVFNAYVARESDVDSFWNELPLF